MTLFDIICREKFKIGDGIEDEIGDLLKITLGFKKLTTLDPNKPILKDGNCKEVLRINRIFNSFQKLLLILVFWQDFKYSPTSHNPSALEKLIELSQIYMLVSIDKSGGGRTWQRVRERIELSMSSKKSTFTPSHIKPSK